MSLRLDELSCFWTVRGFIARTASQVRHRCSDQECSPRMRLPFLFEGT
jgi:hypothetical protein